MFSPLHTLLSDTVSGLGSVEEMEESESVIVSVSSAKQLTCQYPEIVKRYRAIVIFHCVLGLLPWSMRQIISYGALHPSDLKKRLWRKWDILYVCVLMVVFTGFSILSLLSVLRNRHKALIMTSFDADSVTFLVLASAIFTTNAIIWCTWWRRTFNFVQLWFHIQVKIFS